MTLNEKTLIGLIGVGIASFLLLRSSNAEAGFDYSGGVLNRPEDWGQTSPSYDPGIDFYPQESPLTPSPEYPVYGPREDAPDYDFSEVEFPEETPPPRGAMDMCFPDKGICYNDDGSVSPYTPPELRTVADVFTQPSPIPHLPAQ